MMQKCTEYRHNVTNTETKGLIHDSWNLKINFKRKNEKETECFEKEWKKWKRMKKKNEKETESKFSKLSVLDSK